MAEHRVADIDPAILGSLQHHEMLVAADLLQHDGRHLELHQSRGRNAVAASAHAEVLHITLHVEHGKALGAHQFVVGAGEHAVDHEGLVDIEAVGLAQDGGQCRGTATEVGLLLDQVAEAPLADTLHLLEDHGAAGEHGEG
ncbi:hypothetical protein D9M71_307640 [compost metagenome]